MIPNRNMVFRPLPVWRQRLSWVTVVAGNPAVMTQAMMAVTRNRFSLWRPLTDVYTCIGGFETIF
jgi:hypothetical protein